MLDRLNFGHVMHPGSGGSTTLPVTDGCPDRSGEPRNPRVA